MRTTIVDVWMQHPGRAFLADPMFDSRRAGSHGSLPERDIPTEWTLAAMDQAGVAVGLLCAWWVRRAR